MKHHIKQHLGACLLLSTLIALNNALAAGVYQTQLNPPTYNERSFVIPNELRPDVVYDTIAEMNFAGRSQSLWHLSVGTERGWMSVVPSKTKNLMLVDIDPLINWYNAVNLELIKSSPTIEAYRARRFTTDYSVWSAGVQDPNLKTRSNFDLWRRYQSADTSIPVFQGNPNYELSKPPGNRIINRNSESETRSVLPDDYLWDGARYNELRTMVTESRVTIFNADLLKAGDTSLLANFIANRGGAVGVMDLSNVPSFGARDKPFGRNDFSAIGNWDQAIMDQHMTLIETIPKPTINASGIPLEVPTHQLWRYAIWDSGRWALMTENAKKMSTILDILETLPLGERPSWIRLASNNRTLSNNCP